MAEKALLQDRLCYCLQLTYEQQPAITVFIVRNLEKDVKGKCFEINSERKK
nr:hypothetical protein [uncultured Mediterraneibacter sp.]